MNVEIPCVCPPLSTGAPRHQVDTVTLHDTLSFRAALTVRNAIGLIYQEDPGAGAAEVLAAMSETYVLVGIKSWTIVDQRNKPEPVSPANIRNLLLTHWDAATAVAEQADNLYSDKVILPLLNRGSTSSLPMPTDGSTSARDSEPKPRKRSKPSSITTSPTDGIAMMSASPAGDSN